MFLLFFTCFLYHIYSERKYSSDVKTFEGLLKKLVLEYSRCTGINVKTVMESLINS